MKRPCKVPGCINARRYSDGYCTTHHRRVVRDGDVRAWDPLRVQLPAGQLAELEPPVCVCRLDVIRVQPAGFGSVVCSRCLRVPAESFGIEWTAELIESHRNNPRVPT